MSLLLVLAGCNGGGGNGTDNSTASGAISTEYTFSEGELYEYQLDLGQLGSSNVTWDVTAVSDSDVTVNVTTESGSRTSTSELTGTQENIFDKAVQNRQTTIFATLGRIPVEVAAGQDLSEGSEWTVNTGDLEIQMNSGSGSGTPTPTEITANVTNTDRTVNGIDCTEILIQTESEDSDNFNACVAPGYPFALSVTSAGESEVGLELTNAEGR